MPEAVIFINPDRTIIGVNKSFKHVFGYEYEEVQGRKTSILYPSDTLFRSIGKSVYNVHSTADSKSFEIKYRRKNGEVFTSRTTASVVKGEDGILKGYLAVIRDLTNLKRRQEEIKYLTNQLHLLVDITTQQDNDVDRILAKGLELTTNFLNMEIGIISRIQEDEYVVEHYYPGNADLEKNQLFDLGETYCSLVVDSKDIVAIENMGESAHKSHPCYGKFKMESYLGCPIIINDEVVGTVNFSSSLPKDEIFGETDKSMIQILSKWVAGILSSYKAEEELKESRSMYKLISEHATDMVCLHEPDGTYIYVSPSCKWILGYEPEEIIGKSPYDLFHPDDIKTISTESHEQSKLGKRVLTAEYRIKHKNGDYIWFDTSTEPILDDMGNTTGLRTSSRDISYKKRLEVLFNQSQKMARVGGWEYDLKTGKLFWTKEVYAIHEKHPEDEVFVEEALSYYPDNGTRELLQEAMNKTINEGVTTDLELPFITEKGNHRFVRAIIKAMREKDTTYMLYGTFQDITTYKEVEKEIKDKNERLDKLVKATHQINSIIGHDLRSPLSSILGLSELMLHSINNDGSIDVQEVKESAQLINQASANMSKLLSDLLKWSRVQTGQIKLKKEEIELKELLGSTVNLLETPAKEKGIQLKFHCDGSNKVLADKNIVPTIIRNFVSNAIKFSSEGDTIELRCDDEQDNTGIVVKDEGEGMTKEVVDSLFHENLHPSNTGTNNEPGTGLGLRLSKRLAEVHGAQIKVKSEYGKGSEFSLILPKYYSANITES